MMNPLTRVSILASMSGIFAMNDHARPPYGWNDLPVELQDTLIGECYLSDIPSLSRSSQSVLDATRRRPDYDECILRAAQLQADDIDMALQFAIISQRERAACLLLEHGADPSRDNYEALHQAALRNYRHLFERMWQQVQQLGKPVPTSEIVLHLYADPALSDVYNAAMSGNLEGALAQLIRHEPRQGVLIYELTKLFLQDRQEMRNCRGLVSLLSSFRPAIQLNLLRHMNNKNRAIAFDIDNDEQCRTFMNSLLSHPQPMPAVREFLLLLSSDADFPLFIAKTYISSVVPLMVRTLFALQKSPGIAELTQLAAQIGNPLVLQECWKVSPSPENAEDLLDNAINSDSYDTFKMVLSLTNTRVPNDLVKSALLYNAYRVIKGALEHGDVGLNPSVIYEILGRINLELSYAISRLYFNNVQNAMEISKDKIVPLAKLMVEMNGVGMLLDVTVNQVSLANAFMLSVLANDFIEVSKLIKYSKANGRPIPDSAYLYLYALSLNHLQIAKLFRVVTFSTPKPISNIPEPYVEDSELTKYLNDGIIGLDEVMKFLAETHRANPVFMMELKSRLRSRSRR